jgi:thioredoxin-related protein
MKTKILLLLIFFWAIPSGFAQLKVYTFDEVAQLSKENPKPIVVFIHTNWCKYCKMMENSTFKNEEVIKILNQDFYFISLDAETKNDIIYNNQRFIFIPNGKNTGIHELATALATIDKQISYPTLSILDSSNTILFQKNSFLNTKTVLTILKTIKL